MSDGYDERYNDDGVTPGMLGAIKPPDQKHIEKYPVAVALERPTFTPVPGILGINWRSGYNKPVKGSDGKYRIPLDALKTPVEGGHAIMLPHAAYDDMDPAWLDTLYKSYDQGQVPACVAYSWSYCMSLLNGIQYYPPKLYAAAQAIDGIPGQHDGTTVRAGGDVLRDDGHWRYAKSGNPVKKPRLVDGIIADRWATDMNDALAALGRSGASEIAWANSWGVYYPRLVYVPVELLAHELDAARNNGGSDYAEIVFPTDRPGPVKKG